MPNTAVIEKEVKSLAVQTLNATLIDSLELYVHIKMGHWNLRGPGFLPIHRFLDEVAKVVQKGSDEIAERIRQLNAPVTVTSHVFSEQNRLPKFPEGEILVEDAIEAVTASLKEAIRGIREGISDLEEAEEPISADLLTKIAGELEVQMWLLSSNLPRSKQALSL